MAIVHRNEGSPQSRWRGLDPFELMREIFQWGPESGLIPGASKEAGFIPSFDVKETKDAYVFQADLPGVKEEDIDVSLTGSRLTVSGKREAESTEKEEQYYAWERSYGSFARSFTLPEGVDANQVHAELKDGVLKLVLPKKPEVQAKRISLKGEGKKLKA